MPAASSLRATSSCRIPCCIQTSGGRISSKASSSAGMCSERRKMLTISMGPVAGRRPKIGMDRLAQSHAADRMHRDDGVPGALKIGGHAVARPLRFPAQAHHRDPPGAADQLRQPCAVRRHSGPPRRDAAGVRSPRVRPAPCRFAGRSRPPGWKAPRRRDIRQPRPCRLERELGRDPAGHQQAQPSPRVRRAAPLPAPCPPRCAGRCLRHGR